MQERLALEKSNFQCFFWAPAAEGENVPAPAGTRLSNRSMQRASQSYRRG